MFQIIAKNKYTLSQMKMMWSCKSKVKSKEWNKILFKILKLIKLKIVTFLLLIILGN